jgi:hypothetical protein
MAKPSYRRVRTRPSHLASNPVESRVQGNARLGNLANVDPNFPLVPGRYEAWSAYFFAVTTTHSAGISKPRGVCHFFRFSRVFRSTSS